MDYNEIINRLKAVKGHFEKHVEKDKNTAKIWQKDIDALMEAMDIVSDYEKAAAQNAEMVQRYEMPEITIRRSAGIYVCPLCGKRTQVGHTHCHWCGKKLSWNKEAYAQRDYPHMSRKGDGDHGDTRR